MCVCMWVDLCMWESMLFVYVSLSYLLFMDTSMGTVGRKVRLSVCLCMGFCMGDSESMLFVYMCLCLIHQLWIIVWVRWT